MCRRLLAVLQVHRLQLLLLLLGAILGPGARRLQCHDDRLCCGYRLPAQHCGMLPMLRMRVLSRLLLLLLLLRMLLRRRIHLMVL